MENDTNFTGGLDVISKPNINNDSDKKLEVIERLDNFLAAQNEDPDKCLTFKKTTITEVRNRLQRARNEFNSTRFFILVVGPLKSGKSTFVNILCRANVSPTDILECTAIPTIVGKATGDHQNTIIEYFPNAIETHEEIEDQSTREPEIFNKIIDVLRGIETPEALNDIITMKSSEATPDNISSIVTNKGYNRPMIATIGARSDIESFISDDIMIIDMPGLDGKDVNEHNNPLYQEMVKRADFIFFVQSSTSAINEATSDFLQNLLSNRLTNVPLRLIHNIHESLYYINDDTTEKMIQAQIDNGVDFVRERFKVKNNFCNYKLNFAKIYNSMMSKDSIKEEYKEEAQKAHEEYLELEKLIVEELKSDRQKIKDQNNITKAKENIKIAVDELRVIAVAIATRVNEINEITEYARTLPAMISAVNLPVRGYDAIIDQLLEDNNVEGVTISNMDTATQNRFQQSDISGAALKKEIDLLASEFNNSSPLGDRTLFRRQLISAIQEDLTSGYNDVIDNILTFINSNIEEGELPLVIDHTIDSSHIPKALSEFPSGYSDIKNRRLIGTVKYYNVTRSKNYLTTFRDVSKQLLTNKLDDYKRSVIISIAAVKNSYTDDIITQINTKLDSINSRLSTEIEYLTKQQEILNKLLDILT